MAGTLGSGDQETISEINVTPFVDVVLVLLVIFMVTAGFIVNKGVKVELPQAATAEQLSSQTTFNILVAANGDVLLDGELISKETLAEKGRVAKDSGEKVVAMIAADKGVIYSYVVGVMDTLRTVGINDFALQLEPLPAKQAENTSSAPSNTDSSK